MPKVEETKNRIIVRVGDTWKKGHANWKFRYHDVGRSKNTLRLSSKSPRGRWMTYAWSFTKEQVMKIGRSLLVYDQKAFDILKRMKINGDLKGYRIVNKIRR